MHEEINLKTGSFVPDGLQTENVLSCEIIFGAEIADNGLFLCAAEQWSAGSAGAGTDLAPPPVWLIWPEVAVHRLGLGGAARPFSGRRLSGSPPQDSPPGRPGPSVVAGGAADGGWEAVSGCGRVCCGAMLSVLWRDAECAAARC